jgi:hypothetical protein
MQAPLHTTCRHRYILRARSPRIVSYRISPRALHPLHLAKLPPPIPGHEQAPFRLSSPAMPSRSGRTTKLNKHGH